MSVSAFSDVVRARVMARSGGFCEVRVAGCGGEASQLHHRRARGMGGSRNRATGQASNAVSVCLPCHDYIETNRELARDRGWLVRQGVNPCDIPVYRYRQWVLLDDEGGLRPVEVTT